MIVFLSIIIGVVTILVLITMHEFAHFLIAKFSGAYVYEFSVGMGPKVFQWGKKETKYTLRLLPLGGYVSIASELVDPPKGREDEVVAEKQLMENLHRGKKALFLSGGSLMNLFLAFILLIVGYAIYPYKQDLQLAPTYTTYGPVYEAVLQYNQKPENINKQIAVDAKIVEIFNANFKNEEKNSRKEISDYYQLNDWIKEYNVEVKKGDEILSPEIEITFNSGQIISNIKPDAKDNFFLGVTASSFQLNSGQIIADSFIDTFKNSYSVLQALGKMLTFQWGQLSGPVGIIKSTSSFLDANLTAQQSFSTFFRWASLLSANLFLLNMLPVPPLDGYKFVENAIEAVVRKKINAKFKIIVSIIGALLFLGIFIAITIKDIWF